MRKSYEKCLDKLSKIAYQELIRNLPVGEEVEIKTPIHILTTVDVLEGNSSYTGYIARSVKLGDDKKTLSVHLGGPYPGDDSLVLSWFNLSDDKKLDIYNALC